MNASSMIDIESNFKEALLAYDLNPSEIVADGKIHRFDASDDKRGKKSAWYVLYDGEVPAGSFGNWKTNLSETWCSTALTTLSAIEKQRYHEHIQKAKAQAETEKLAIQIETAKICNQIWNKARDATTDNPYCQRKGIKPYGLKEFHDTHTLLVPIRDDAGRITSLQFVDKEGGKKFKSGGRIDGCYYSFGGKPVDTILICEGFATGATLHQATGYPVAVAFNAGNLEAVAKTLRAKLPKIKIVICADHDKFSATGNTGLKSAAKAARSISGLLAVPEFVDDGGKLTDFNDLAQSEGLPVVKAIIEKVLREVTDTSTANPRTTETHTRTVNIRCGADIQPLPITWLWPGWLPAGKLTILAGAAGTGKTTLALGLAAALTVGGRWPDSTHCATKGNVLVWSSEDSPDDTLVPRLIASGADISRCHFIDGITDQGESVPFNPSQDILDLHRAVEKIGGVSLLIIDPIVSAVSGDMHRANDVRRSLQTIVDFATAHGCAVIGISHFSKGGATKTPQDRVIGSQAFGALARMVLVAAKEEGSSRRVLARAKSNIAQDDGGVEYSLQLTTIDGGIESTYAVWEGVIDGTAREILGEVEHDEEEGGDSRNDLERMLIDTLEYAGGKIAVKTLQAEVRDAGYSWDSAKRLKKVLGIESVKLSMSGAWMWCLPGKVPPREQTTPEGSEGSAKYTVHSSASFAHPSEVSNIEVSL